MNQQEEDFIYFQEISPEDSVIEPHGLNMNGINKAPIPGEFSNLQEELLFRCNPSNFLKPYNQSKIDVANDIYEILQNGTIDLESLKELRGKAIRELDVKFSTITLYNILIKACNPKNFTDANYNAAKLRKANGLYSKITENADNIEILEEIKDDAEELITLYQQREQERKRVIEEENRAKEEENRAKEEEERRKIEKDEKEIQQTVLIFLVIIGLSIVIFQLLKLYLPQ